MKYFLTIWSSFIFITCSAQSVPGVEKNRVLLPNGWNITPAGKNLPLGDLPLNIAVSKTGRYAAVTNNGQSTQSIQLFDAEKNAVLDKVNIRKAWYGLKFSGDEKHLYASGGNDNVIWEYALVNNRLQLSDSFYLSHDKNDLISPAGIDIDETSGLLYVVTKENNALYIIDISSHAVKAKINLKGEAFTCVLSPDEKTLYISCWGCDSIICFDTKKMIIAAEIAAGDNPNEIILNRKGDLLFVANANDNSVSVINTRTRRAIETINTALYADAPSGSTTNSIALSGDERTMYVANADNNCLAVFDITKPGQSRIKGFIPVGWYPTNVRYIHNKLFVANGKGLQSFANPYGPDPYRKKQAVIYQKGDSTQQVGVQYIGGLFKGTLSIIDVPDPRQLDAYTKSVYANTPYTKQKESFAEGETGNPIPQKKADASPIKYVFYVIKENRTYDQVLGDMPAGNGDTSLVLFGKFTTPNQHKLAEQFVLLDNFYVDAEVSADGHNWSMGAYATDYLEKTWPTSYGGRGGNYDGEGTRGIANNKLGFIWDQCKRNHISYRSYGEFTDEGKPNIPALKDHICNYFTGFDLAVKDTERFSQWKRDFDSLLNINAVPSFNTIRFGNDHTEGLRKNSPTPAAFVADNDLAVGMFIEHLSRSPIWDKTAVFILEDDAQNGSDHVDAHRSTAYLAGGFVKRDFTDHTFYTTSSMLRTMELILGMPPMTQYDAAAKPMWRCFSHTADSGAFTALPSNIFLDQKNTAENHWQKISEKFNFTEEDAVPDNIFNEVIWVAVKGEGKPYPAPKHSAFVKSTGN